MQASSSSYNMEGAASGSGGGGLNSDAHDGPTRPPPSPLLAIPPPPPLEAMTTNAVTRSLSDLHTPTWLALLAVNITGRTLVFHPMQLAISRKRVTRSERPPSVRHLMTAAFRGGYQSFPLGSGKGSRVPLASVQDVHNFGRGGIRGCYRGLGAALISNLIGEVSYLFTLETLKERLGDERKRSKSAAAASAATDGTSTDGNSSNQSNSTSGGGGGSSVEADDFTADSAPAAVGAMAGDLVALALVTPMVVLCNRQMTAGYGMASGNAYRSVPDTFREVWCAHQSKKRMASGATRLQRLLSPAWWRDGLRGIYQGTSAGLLRIPSSGCWWALYTKSKETVYTIAAPGLTRIEERRKAQENNNNIDNDMNIMSNDAATTGGNTNDNNSSGKSWQSPRGKWLLSPTDNPLLNAIAGIVASVCTTVLFNPVAVIQTRQQSLPADFFTKAKTTGGVVTGAGAHWSRRAVPFQKVYAVAADLVRTEGPRAFFKGATANVGVAVMDGVIFSLLFEMSKLGSDTQFMQHMGVDPVAL